MRKFLILCILIPFMGMSQLVDSPVVRPDSTYIHSNEVDTARKQITFKDTTTFLAYLISDQAQLEKITEGGHTGWAILGRTAANYGDIGSNAVDLTLSYATSSTYGATGSVSFSTGRYTTASGEYSASFGNYTIASNARAFVIGSYGNASGQGSFCGGMGTSSGNSESSGYSSFIFQYVEPGVGTKASIALSSAILGGRNNEISVTGTNSVILGGSGVSLTDPNTVKVPHLQVDSTATLSGVLNLAGAATMPTSPSEGDIFHKTGAADSLFIYMDSKWQFINLTDR